MNSTLSPTATKRSTPLSPSFKVRRVSINYDEAIPDLWYDNDVFKTMLLVSLSAVFPEGEQHFIDSVRLYQDQITDPELKKQIRAFIGQEAHHSKQHEGLNQLMADKGYPVGKIEKRITKMMKALSNASPSLQLADTVCSEHFTAILVNYFITHAPDEIDKFSPTMQSLWAWHCIEESEHKAVAFDVYKQTVNKSLFLRSYMVLVTTVFTLNTLYGVFQLLRKTNEQWNFSIWRDGMKFLFGRGGLFSKIKSDYFAFYRKDFHPWQLDNRKELAIFKERYFGQSEFKALFE